MHWDGRVVNTGVAFLIGLDFWHSAPFGSAVAGSVFAPDELIRLADTNSSRLALQAYSFEYMCLCAVCVVSLALSLFLALFSFRWCVISCNPITMESWPYDPNNQLHLYSLCSWFTINNGFAFAKHNIQRNQAKIFIISLKHQYVGIWIVPFKCLFHNAHSIVHSANVCAHLVCRFLCMWMYLQQRHSMIWPLEMHQHIQMAETRMGFV